MLKRLLVSGYKAHELGIFKEKDPKVHYIKKAIEQKIRGLIEQGLEWVIVSGQAGVELWTAEVVLTMKKEYPAIRLAIITPFLEQEGNWKPDRQEQYREIMRRADFTDSVSKQPYQAPWQFTQKNTFLIANSDGLLLLFEEDGSPKYLLQQAQKVQQREAYEIMTISFQDIQTIIEEEQELERDYYD